MPSETEFRTRFDVAGTLEVIEWPRALSACFCHRVLVTGGRCYRAWNILAEVLSSYAAEQPISELAAGCASGADEMALRWAMNFNVPWRKYRADWMRYGDYAGSKRNIAMLDDFEPDIVIAFPGSVGTTHCLRHARKRGIPRKIIIDGVDPMEDLLRWG